MVRQGVNTETAIYAGRWRRPQPANESSALTPHLTGCMLIEAACKVMAASDGNGEGSAAAQ